MKFSRESFEKTLSQFVKETKLAEKGNSGRSKSNKKKTLSHNLSSRNTHITLPRLLREFVKIISFLMNLYLEITLVLVIERSTLIGFGIHLLSPNIRFRTMIRHGLLVLELKKVKTSLHICYYQRTNPKTCFPRSM